MDNIKIDNTKMLQETQYTIQFYMLLISSLITLGFGSFLNKYPIKGIALHIFKCYILFSGFTLFFISSMLLIKINASEGIDAEIPDWLIPYWYVCSIFAFINFMVTICYVFVIGSINDHQYTSLDNDIIQEIIITFNHKRQRIISVLFSILTIVVILGVFISIRLLCDPGFCD